MLELLHRRASSTCTPHLTALPPKVRRSALLRCAKIPNIQAPFLKRLMTNNSCRKAPQILSFPGAIISTTASHQCCARKYWVARLQDCETCHLAVTLHQNTKSTQIAYRTRMRLRTLRRRSLGALSIGGDISSTEECRLSAFTTSPGGEIRNGPTHRGGRSMAPLCSVLTSFSPSLRSLVVPFGLCSWEAT